MEIKEQRAKFFAGIGAVFLVMALLESMNPSLTRPDGRWSFLYAWAWDAWGSEGIVGFYIFEAAILFIISFVGMRKK